MNLSGGVDVKGIVRNTTKIAALCLQSNLAVYLALLLLCRANVVYSTTPAVYLWCSLCNWLEMTILITGDITMDG